MQDKTGETLERENHGWEAEGRSQPIELDLIHGHILVWMEGAELERGGGEEGKAWSHWLAGC